MMAVYRPTIILLFLILMAGIVPVGSVENDEKTEKLMELRENTIKYGIESQVNELIVQLKDEENDRYNNLLADLFRKTNNDALRISILDLFSSLEDGSISDFVHSQLSEYEDFSPQLVLAMIRYLTKFQDQEVTETFLTLSEAQNSEVATLAIQSIGQSGQEEYGRRLLELMEEEGFNETLEPAVIQALGELKYRPAVEYLSDIAEDDDQSNSLRWRACQALGLIGGEEAFRTIKGLLNADDSYLRAYAVGALKGFTEREVYDVLIDALRDDFWRVRVQALEALGGIRAREALDVLKYKAYHDPDVRNVRLAAVKAIGEIDTREGYEVLRELYADPSIPYILRSKAVELLVENNLTASLDTITELIKTEWGKENSTILDYTCKQLSLTKNNALVDVYRTMLSHPRSINILIYGLRGVRLNRFGSLKPEIEKLTGEEYARSVRQLARSVLDEL